MKLQTIAQGTMICILLISNLACSNTYLGGIRIYDSLRESPPYRTRVSKARATQIGTRAIANAYGGRIPKEFLPTKCSYYLDSKKWVISTSAYTTPNGGVIPDSGAQVLVDPTTGQASQLLVFTPDVRLLRGK
jgi:hypothetical protein